MSAPAVSVVVATRDRPTRLARLLDVLRGQAAVASATVELVVVDDGSGEPTRELLDRRAGRPGMALRIVRHPRPRGPGGARNAGWRAARGGLIAFTDDDCVPAPGWVDALLAVHRAHPDAVVQGRTLPDPGEAAHDGLFSRTLRSEDLGPQYETANIAYPQELLERLGGFAEDFGLAPGGEDTDLAWRAIELGRPTVLAADAVVHHAVARLGPVGSLRVAARWGQTMRIFARHPGLRATLYRGRFWNVWHYLLLRSLLVGAIPARGPLRPAVRALRGLLLARHASALAARGRQAGAGPWSVPWLLAHDAVETAAILRGAVIHRTLVL